MPLIKGKSQKSFVKNLKTELEHGKPMKQSLAIAYAMKRRAKKMADGGPIIMDPDKAKQLSEGFKSALGHSKGGEIKGIHKPYFDEKEEGMSEAGEHIRSMDLRPKKEKEMAMNEHHKVLGEMVAMKKPNLKGLAMGGELESGYEPMPEEHEVENENAEMEDDLVQRIINKKMSKGGQVANDTLDDVDEIPAQYDDLVLRDDLDFSYDGDNSGDMDGDPEEEMRRKDMVSRIMASRRKKDRMPNPA